MGLIILSGPVGAGKSTIAQALLASASGASAYVEGDTFWSFIKRPAVTDDHAQKFKMVMRAMVATARHIERDNYEVILDFSIPPWYLDGVRRLLADKPFDYVVVRPSEAVCAARAKARPAGAIADYAPYHELYVAFEGDERFVIAHDAASAADVAAEIRAGLAAGRFRIA